MEVTYNELVMLLEDLEKEVPFTYTEYTVCGKDEVPVCYDKILVKHNTVMFIDDDQIVSYSNLGELK